MARKHLIRLAHAALLLLFVGRSETAYAGLHSVEAEDLQTRLRSSVHNYQLHGLNFVEALVKVGSDFNIPMGIEWIQAPSAQAKVDLSWENAHVNRILETLVKTQPAYKMQIMASIVRISPKGLIPDSQNPLRLQITSFEVKDVPVERASRELHVLLKRRMWTASSTAGSRQGIAGSGASNLDDPRVSVRLENTTAEEALDELALVSGRKIWIVTFSADQGLTAAGFRRTLTLWNDFPIPDEDQPLWDLLHWGDPIPDVHRSLK